MKIITNNVPRPILDSYELTPAERAEFGLTRSSAVSWCASFSTTPTRSSSAWHFPEEEHMSKHRADVPETLPPAADPLLDGARFRVKFYEGERLWGVEHNAPVAHVTELLAMWSGVCKADEYIVIEQGNER